MIPKTTAHPNPRSWPPRLRRELPTTARGGLAATLWTCIALGLAGCTTPMLRAHVEVPERYAKAAIDDQSAAAELAWWQRYEDPVLTALIRRAARNNRDVRIAGERVRAARAGATISRSALLPSVGLSASAARSENDYGDAARLAVPENERSSAGLEVSWEIDLTGRLRAGAAAAAADAVAVEAQARGVRLLVLTDVASNYFILTGALRQLDLARAIAAAQDETLRLVRARRRVGLASPFDVERARTDAERARAAIPPLDTLVAVARHRIAVLTGDQAANAAAIVPHVGPLQVPEVSPGQPAVLLERRPDLLGAQAQLAAANWRRRQAATEWFPRLFASALFGRQHIDVHRTGLGSARFGNAAGLLAMPLLDWGRTRAINEIADAGQSEALLRYEDAIVRALEDVENALVTLRDERQRLAYLDRAAASAEAALGRARSLYRHGQIDLLPLLDAQRAQLQVRMSANDSQTQLLLNSVRLFKALGGGWQVFEPDPAPTPTNSSPPAAASQAANVNEELS